MKYIVVLALSLLAGCGIAQRHEHQQRLNAASAQMNTGIAACRAKYPSPTNETILARSKCINDAEAFMQPFAPYPDLYDLRSTTRMAIAEKQARGQISVNEAAAQFASFHSQNVAEEQRRSTINRSVSAQETAALAAYRASLGTTCTRYGNTVSCF